MKKIILFLICISFILIPIDVHAASSEAVLDIDSGRTLVCNNCHEKRLIASITKIMTAVITLEQKDPKDIVTAKEEILKPTHIKIEDLLKELEKLDNYTIITNDEVNIDGPKEEYNPDILKIVEKYKDKENINPHALNPDYLKLTEAEEKVQNV